MNVISANESVMFAGAGLDSVWKDSRFSAGLKYLRTIMMGNSVGAFSVTNVNVGYLINVGDLNYYGAGVDYQIGGFNFGQIPMLGVRIFGGGTFFLSDGPDPYIWEASVSGAYSANSSVYEIQNIWRADMSFGKAIFDNVLAVLGLDYRNFSYRAVGTTSGYTSLSLLAMSIGLGMTY